MKKKSDFGIIIKLFTLFSKHNKLTIILCALLSLVTGTRPYIAIVLSGMIIDGLVEGKGFGVIMQYTLVGLTVILAAQLLEAYLRELFNARVENCMERQNYDMNAQSLVLDYEQLENPDLQEKKRKQEQVVNVRGGIYWMIIWPLDKGLTGAVSVISAFIVAIPLFHMSNKVNGILSSNWLLVLLFGALAGCAYCSFKTNTIWNKKFKDTFETYAECSKVSNYFLHNMISGTETLKDQRIFMQEELIEKGIFHRESEGNKLLKRLRVLEMQGACIENSISNFSGACVYLYAALKAYMGVISIGSVVRYAASIIKCVDGLIYLLMAISGWKQAAEYGRDYLDYVEFEQKKVDGAISSLTPDKNLLELEFDHVSFKYPGSDNYVIKDLNLKLNLGERMAIVGKNGSGKTTFIKLLSRLYDVTEGEIRLNKIDIRKYDKEEYMKIFSVVFQDYRIFSLKVGENIAACEQVDESKALDALEKAGLKERLDKMPDGLDTYVGKEFEGKGVNVSGGERQKMAIARAIYKGAPFVIMDEPTAALDPISECDVYAGFDKMVGNKAAIYISHRLASCRFCKDILVFDNGNIVQQGSHEKLAREEGLYQKLWNAQAQYYEVSV
ncbi:MAG: ABC transporter ATP-binding protein [Anaerocolumna sp.]